MTTYTCRLMRPTSERGRRIATERGRKTLPVRPDIDELFRQSHRIRLHLPPAARLGATVLHEGDWAACDQTFTDGAEWETHMATVHHLMLARRDHRPPRTPRPPRLTGPRPPRTTPWADTGTLRPGDWIQQTEAEAGRAARVVDPGRPDGAELVILPPGWTGQVWSLTPTGVVVVDDTQRTTVWHRDQVTRLGDAATTPPLPV